MIHLYHKVNFNTLNYYRCLIIARCSLGMLLFLSSYKPVLLSVLVTALVLPWYANNYYHFLAPVYAKIARSRGGINLHDPNLKAEVVANWASLSNNYGIFRTK